MACRITARAAARSVDPRNTPRGKRILESMRKICLALPDTSEGLQFGQSVWRAGKKVFAQAYCYEERWQVGFWVGVHAPRGPRRPESRGIAVLTLEPPSFDPPEALVLAHRSRPVALRSPLTAFDAAFD
jgi:hypothetical protein